MVSQAGLRRPPDLLLKEDSADVDPGDGPGGIRASNRSNKILRERKDK
jgi:hypothetical protein